VTADRFFEAIQERFERAAAVTGLRERDALVAGVHVRFRVAGGDLATALSAGLHPFPEPDPGSSGPAAILSYFDSASSGQVPPAPPWPADAYRPRDEIRGYTTGRWRATYSLLRSTLWFHDTEVNRGVGWMRDFPAPDDHERAVPWWAAFHLALPAAGVLRVHAGAVGEALLVGVSGSGKSTTTYAAALAGIPCAGDDHVAVTEDAEGWRVHALYRWARLDEAALARFPETPVTYRGDDEKAGVVLPSAVESMPVRAIIAPTVSERTGRLRALSRAGAMRALAPSSVLQAPGGDSATVAALGRLVRAVPTFSLEVGPDLEAIPAAIEEATMAAAR
jgi:hypothetical protein